MRHHWRSVERSVRDPWRSVKRSVRDQWISVEIGGDQGSEGSRGEICVRTCQASMIHNFRFPNSIHLVLLVRISSGRGQTSMPKTVPARDHWTKLSCLASVQWRLFSERLELFEPPLTSIPGLRRFCIAVASGVATGLAAATAVAAGCGTLGGGSHMSGGVEVAALTASCRSRNSLMRIRMHTYAYANIMCTV